MKKFKLKHWINYIILLALAIPFTVMFFKKVQAEKAKLVAQAGEEEE